MGSAPRPPPREPVQKSGSIFPTPKLKVGATQQGWPVGKKKSPFSPDPRTFKHVAISLPKQDSPETVQTTRGARLSSRFHPDGHGRWGAQPEHTRTKKGLASGGEERGENAGPGGRGLGLCRPVELTPSSCPQRPSSQLPSVLEFGMPCAPRRATRGMSPAARSWHCGDSGTLSPRSHLPLPASARGLRNQPSKGYTTRSTRRPRGQCWRRRV